MFYFLLRAFLGAGALTFALSCDEAPPLTEQAPKHLKNRKVIHTVRTRASPHWIFKQMLEGLSLAIWPMTFRRPNMAAPSSP